MKRHSATRARNVSEAKRLYGTRCVNCGSDKGIQFHHAVSLSCGGNDVATNMIPLCRECHAKVHGVIGNLIKTNNGGCPKRKLCDAQRLAVDYYVNCELPASVLKKLLGIKSHLSKTESYIQESMKRNGIIDFRNNMDVRIGVNGKIEQGEKSGWVIREYVGKGKRKEYRYSPDYYDAESALLEMM